MRVSRCWRGARSAGCPISSKVESFRCMVERRFDAMGSLKTVSEAIVKVTVDGEERMSVAEGHGPINALDIALRKDRGKFQAEIDDLETGRLQGAHPQWRHRGDHPCADRIRGFVGRTMVDRGFPTTSSTPPSRL